MEIAYVTLQGVNLKLVGIVEDEDKMIKKEIFGFELKGIRQIETMKPDAVFITSLQDIIDIRLERLGNLLSFKKKVLLQHI